jgi:uncharacterized protein YcaQ
MGGWVVVESSFPLEVVKRVQDRLRWAEDISKDHWRAETTTGKNKGTTAATNEVRKEEPVDSNRLFTSWTSFAGPLLLGLVTGYLTRQ